MVLMAGPTGPGAALMKTETNTWSQQQSVQIHLMHFFSMKE